MDDEKAKPQESEEDGFKEAQKYKDLEKIRPEIRKWEESSEKPGPSSLEDLEGLKIPGEGMKTSSGSVFEGKDVWTRDMSITGEDLIDIDPALTEEAILTLAKYQGVASNPRTGERVGRMHTESRDIFSNKKLNMLAKIGISTASKLLWKGSFKEYTNYFSSDTTPLYVRTVFDYAEKHPEVLEKKVEKKDGSVETIYEATVKAAEYIESTVSEDGLIRINEENVFGNQYRYWRDSPNSYRDERGKLPNITDDMVILDVQGLSAEALDDAAKMVQQKDPEKSKRWLRLASKIKQATIQKMWMEDEQYFAYGLHKDPKTKEMIPLKTIQSNAGWLLNTDFFDNLTEQEQQKYVGGIIKRICSDEFMTDAGIRCRSVKHIHDRRSADYHGAWVSWPVESYMIAKGLRRQGFARLADQVETRIVNAVNMSGVNYEFFVIDPEGRVLLNPKKKPSLARVMLGLGKKNLMALPMEMTPENTIGWTVTATLRIKKERALRWLKEHNELTPNIEPEVAWKKDLEDEVLEKMKIMKAYRTKEEIEANKFQEPDLYLAGGKGKMALGWNMAAHVLPKIVKRRFTKK